MEVQVRNRLWMKLDELPKLAANELRELFEHSNPEYHKIVAMGYRTNETPIIRTWKHVEVDDETWLTLPRGGTNRVRAIADKFDLDYEFVDQTSLGDLGAVGGAYTGDWVTPQVFPTGKLRLWDHQERVIEAILRRKQCIVRAPTGSGKTTALIEAIRRANVPTIVVVWESGLFEQWQKRVRDELGVPIKKQGVIQGGKFKPRAITIAMQQTLARWNEAKWKRVEGMFGFVASDEVQRYAANTYGHVIDRFDALFRVGISADETRKDKKHFLIYDHYGQVELEVKKSELVGKGVIHDVGVDVVPSNFAAPWYAVDDDDNPDEGNFTKLLEQMIADEERNDLIVEMTRQRYEAGETILLFSHRVEHCHTLRMMLAKKKIPTGFMLGGAGNHEDFIKTVERLRDREDPLRVAVGTLGKVGVGLDIPNLTCGIATTPIHNNRQFMDQVKGRICRKSDGKTHADLIYIWDRRALGNIPLINLKRWNGNVTVRHAGMSLDVNTYLKEHYESEKPKLIGPFASAEDVRRGR